ncbi:DUF3347 domain-containing protein [Salinimicrobium sediminilitoris]|uniref:DUF3347 domain-containing protein n=1 Tax=Salinimicrobium sediminilitoris TaxID=2876715 RepID=UPI001E5DB1FC|nr:DUF3347 domain-containing protein [Salinimicrobium sediminilitoris]MCC8360926.1 DUF3347 domain-containing protein [Salinimicrobium sediminilitoris]
MKRTKMSIMALAGAFLLASCGETKKENEIEDGAMPMQNEMHMEETDDHNMDNMNVNLDDGAQGDLAFNNQNMEAVYNHYMHVKTALVNTNAEEAKSGAQMMTEALQNAGGNEEALNAAQTIAQTDDINVQRTTFQDLSDAMENMLTGELSSGEVYKQYCPMAFDGKGAYWLSSSEEIRNPYYGDKMLKCGSVRDTIK